MTGLIAVTKKHAMTAAARTAGRVSVATPTLQADSAKSSVRDLPNARRARAMEGVLGARSKTNFFVMMSMKQRGFPHAERARGTVQSCHPGFSLVDAPDNAMRVSRICTGVTCSAKEHGGTPLWLV